MEPFLITCPGCKIRLQITNPDFVGREFACPRCKTRLAVKEPTAEEKAALLREAGGESATGHVTGTFRLGPPKNQSQDATTAIGEFADIESVLAGGPIKTSSKWIDQPKIEPVVAADAEAGPASPRAAQQRWTLLIFAIVGGSLAALMVTSLVIYVLSTNQENKPAEVAKGPVKGVPEKPPVENPKTETATPGGEAEAKPVEGEMEKPTLPSQTGETKKPPEAKPGETEATKPTPPASPTEKTKEPETPPGLTPEEGAKAGTPPSGEAIPDAIKDALQGTTTLTAPGGRGSLKAQGGLLDLPDVDPTIFKPKPQLVDVQSQLGETFAQVRGQNMPLVDFLDLLSQLSGVPVSLDPAVYARAGMDPKSPVSVIAEGKNLRQIAETALRPLNLDIVVLGGGLVVTFPEKSPPPALDLGGITLAAAQTADFEKLIKQSVDAQRWGEPPAGAKLAIAGNQIQYQGPARVAWGVKNLLDAVRLAASDQTPPLAGEDLLKKPIVMKDARRMRLSDWTAKLETVAGCEILIDWVSLGGIGWNLDTMVSQAAQGESLGDVLRKFCEPRALAFRQLTPNVVEITTFLELYAGADARVVSVKKQLDAGATPEKIHADLAKAIAPAIPKTTDPRSFVQMIKSPPIAAIRGPASVQVLAEQWLNGGAAIAKPEETKPAETPTPDVSVGAGS